MSVVKKALVLAVIMLERRMVSGLSWLGFLFLPTRTKMLLREASYSAFPMLHLSTGRHMAEISSGKEADRQMTLISCYFTLTKNAS